MTARPITQCLASRNVVADVETALEKGKSPFTLAHVLDWNARGLITWLIGQRMTASYMERKGKLEIVHVAGEWNIQDAQELFGQYKAEAERRGLKTTWGGRRGWHRFLRMKGFRE